MGNWQGNRHSQGTGKLAHSGGGIVKVNKYLYLWIVQGHYGCGWEDLCASENYKEARANLREYQENEPGVAHRKIQRRELNSREAG